MRGHLDRFGAWGALWGGRFGWRQDIECVPQGSHGTFRPLSGPASPEQNLLRDGTLPLGHNFFFFHALTVFAQSHCCCQLPTSSTLLTSLLSSFHSYIPVAPPVIPDSLVYLCLDAPLKGSSGCSPSSYLPLDSEHHADHVCHPIRPLLLCLLLGPVTDRERTRNSTVYGSPESYWAKYDEISSHYVQLNIFERLWAAWYAFMQNDVLATGIMSFALHEVVYFGRSLPWMIIDRIPALNKYKIQNVRAPQTPNKLPP